MRNNATVVNVPDSAFAAPPSSCVVLEGALARSLKEIAGARVRRADALLPPLGEIRKEKWTGATQTLLKEVNAYREDAERVTAAFIKQAEELLQAARLEEQAKGLVLLSPLYRALEASFVDGAFDEWETEMTPLLEKLKDPEKRFRERLHSVAAGKLGKKPAYDKLVATMQQAIGEAVALVDERCRRMLHARIGQYVAERLSIMVNNRDMLLKTAGNDAATRAREAALEGSRIARGVTAVNHDASIPPPAALIETIAGGSAPFIADGKINLKLFWAVFGGWASGRNKLFAEEPAAGAEFPFARALHDFLYEHAAGVFGRMTLADVYAQTGAPLPLTDLQERSRVPVDLMDIDSLVRRDNVEVRAAAVPENLDGVYLAAGWARKKAADPNRLKLLQDFRGFSARAVLGHNLPELGEALDERAVSEESSTPILRDAVARHRIVQRIKGELAATGGHDDDGAAPPTWLSTPAGRDGASCLPVDGDGPRGEDGDSDEERRLKQLLERDVASGNGSTEHAGVAQ